MEEKKADGLKTKNEVLIAVMLKAMAKQPLTSDEKLLLAENNEGISEMANTTKNVAKSGILEKKLLNEHKENFSAWFKKLTEQTFETADQFCDYLIAEESAMPILTKKVTIRTGKKGSGKSKPISPIEDEPGENTYPGIVKNALVAAGEKGLTFEKVGTAIEKAKPESAKLNATGKEKLWEVYARRTPTWFPNVKITTKEGTTTDKFTKGCTCVWGEKETK